MLEIVKTPTPIITLNPEYHPIPDSELKQYYDSEMKALREYYESRSIDGFIDYSNRDKPWNECDFIDDVSNLRDCAFAGCRYSRVNLPNLTTIPERCFMYAQIYYFDLPEVTTINSYGFMYIQALRGFNMPKLNYIKNYGMSSIKNGTVKELYFPSVTMIGDCAFYGSTAFQEIRLPNLKYTLDDQEFASNSILKVIDIGKIEKLSPSSIYSTPFYSCPKLEALIMRSPKLVTSTVVANRSGLFYYYTDEPMPYIYVPKALVEDYKVATNWSVAADYFRAIEDYPEICEVQENGSN